MTEEPGREFSMAELRLAARNHAIPLEALRYDVTPVGLHYLLAHFDIPLIDPAGWRLTVDGGAGAVVELSLGELQAMPAVTRRATMECAGNGRAFLDPRPLSQPWLHEAVGTCEWTGVPVADVLASVELASDAVEVVFTGADRGVEHDVEQPFARSLTVAEATGPDALLAYAVNGQPLPPQHGSPLRLVVVGWYGMTNVKWLASITAATKPFTGDQQLRSYRVRYRDDEPGEPLSRMRPRALMIPPGIPEFPSRQRYASAGEHVLRGRAWSGHAPITGVAVSTDGGESWDEAAVEAPTAGPGVWQSWSYTWSAAPGRYELCCRATDGAGHSQPNEASWNAGGYVNNAVQRVSVIVS
jgi:DMSO/TMAO reductase YedYZ molybdopterin-dependent catalytic subunit